MRVPLIAPSQHYESNYFFRKDSVHVDLGASRESAISTEPMKRIQLHLFIYQICLWARNKVDTVVLSYLHEKRPPR